jgi:hypothetical protein
MIIDIKKIGNIDENKIKELVKIKLDDTIKERVNNIVTNLVKEVPKIKNIPNIEKPEVAISVKEIKDKLENVNLDKLDIKQILRKKEKEEVDLEKLNQKLEKINFNEVTKDFNNQEFSLYDINSLLNLNELIKDTKNIPTYKCCTPNIGEMVNIDLCKAGDKVLDQEKFFFAKGNDDSLVLITQPQPYNRLIGEKIIGNLEEPHNLF